jgi:hypothetical protein
MPAQSPFTKMRPKSQSTRIFWDGENQQQTHPHQEGRLEVLLEEDHRDEAKATWKQSNIHSHHTEPLKRSPKPVHT